MAALVVCAALPAADAAYMLCKAELAQHLIKRAWADPDQQARPWPWADTHPVARLNVDRLGLQTWVLSGATGNVLAFGPGLATGSSQPGHRGVTLIGGHRDTHFKPLQHIKNGDVIDLQGLDRQWHRYRVTSIDIADSRTESIISDTPEATLLLVTCYPFNALTSGGPLRYVVEAELLATKIDKNPTTDAAQQAVAGNFEAYNGL
ncbi:sortase, marine proteobacterial type [Chromatiales bacterium (ex Bugula neritina AB1)]|nr:sortase, marine proteobacterial type [Chromatiales bacterium (ex Bugula neritina AB1)]